jgi:uncharacterized protein (DUF488 family)
VSAGEQLARHRRASAAGRPESAGPGALPDDGPDVRLPGGHAIRPGIVGVGYEGGDVGSFTAGLRAAGVQLVVDVRLNAISRKKGFSKRALAAALTAAGIGYWHVPELGNPTWNRSGFSGPPGAADTARARFSELITTDVAEGRIAAIAAAAAAQKVAVMCFEADESRCHRAVILARLHACVAASPAGRAHPGCG